MICHCQRNLYLGQAKDWMFILTRRHMNIHLKISVIDVYSWSQKKALFR
jgi:hypothetical protein